MVQQDALASGRYKRMPDRWQTEFGRWVNEFGVPRIVEALSADPDLRVTSNAIYKWLGGVSPHPFRALALVELSGGQISLRDIYQHCRDVRGETAGEPMSTASIPRVTAQRQREHARMESQASKIARGIA